MNEADLLEKADREFIGLPSATAPRIDGQIALRNARLADPRWQLAFDNVNGKAGYGDGGFVADRLQVTHLGHPGQLSLRAGDYVHDAGRLSRPSWRPVCPTTPAARRTSPRRASSSACRS